MKLYYRAYQLILKIGAYFVKWRTPEVISNDDLYVNIEHKLRNFKSVLIITDAQLLKLGLLDDLLNTIDKSSTNYVIYDKTKPNPTSINVEDALHLYIINKCEAIISFGGGSSIDCGKAVAARIARPKKSIEQLRGLLKVRRRIVPFMAIPTTAGTGSETTIAAVITSEKTHEKCVITDLSIVPNLAVLNAEYTTKLPPSLTGSTGMDALTHAVEAYLGNSNTRKTRQYSLKAIKLIYENLQTAYTDGQNLVARENMLYASFFAGQAFTRAYVGNVHAIAHALGGMYNLPHGLANAIVLPKVLRAYGNSCDKKLGEISDYIGLSKVDWTCDNKSRQFILWIERMNSYMNIPTFVKDINVDDIETMSKRACREANPFYPVPVIWNIDQFSKLFTSLLPPNNTES